MKSKEVNERIGYEMRTQRLIHRMTLAEMARRMGLKSRNSVSLMELGKTMITVADLKQYCDVLGVDYIEILQKASE